MAYRNELGDMPGALTLPGPTGPAPLPPWLVIVILVALLVYLNRSERYGDHE